MGNSVYRRGAPVLVVGAVATLMAAFGIAWGSSLAAAMAPAPRSAVTTTSDFPDTPGDVPPKPIDEPPATPGDPKAMQVPVVTEPVGAAVYETDGGRRRQLCASTPCEITIWKARAEHMIVSLELAGFESARAHIKDVTDVPGGTLRMVFTRAVSPTSLPSSASRAPKLRQGAMHVEGRLPPEVIQRIVRQSFGRFRLCYENGLRTSPLLQGRVVAKFVIDPSGAVSAVSDGGSDLPDEAVTGCVVRGFSNMTFPQPEGGVVKVICPLLFDPPDPPLDLRGF